MMSKNGSQAANKAQQPAATTGREQPEQMPASRAQHPVQSPEQPGPAGKASTSASGFESVSTEARQASNRTENANAQRMPSDQDPELYLSMEVRGRADSSSGAASRQAATLITTTQNKSGPESASEQPVEDASRQLAQNASKSSSQGLIQNSSSSPSQLLQNASDAALAAQIRTTAPTGEESKDLIQLQVQNLMLFDKPKIKQPAENDAANNQAAAANAQQQQRLRLIFEKDAKNTFLVTNPTAIFKFIRQDRFLNLSDDEQLLIVQRLDEILDKCPYNAHLLSEQIVTLNVSRSNQETIEYYRKRTYHNSNEQQKLTKVGDSSTRSTLALTCSSQDLVFQLIHIGLRFCGKQCETKRRIAETILRIIGKICQGRRFLRCHFELIYQFAKTQVNKIMARVKAQGLTAGKQGKTGAQVTTMEGYDRIDYCIRILKAMVTRKLEVGPQNYFFFSGYLSGILLNSKPLQNWPFMKGFSTCMWFKIQEHQASLQDPNNLPVLFNCASNGSGGFECYFNQNKLFYRILPPQNYQPPTIESNGVLISEFTPGKWYFLGLEHDKPYLARAHLTAIVNDKQVVNFPMDYPRFDNQSKLNMVSICTNMVGQMTTFMLFREQISNQQKFFQMYKTYEYGLGAKDTNLSSLSKDIFDPNLMKKLMILYTPHRYHNKIVYDFIDMNDGELLFNCGTWHLHQKPMLADVGGVASLLPLFENIKTLISLESSRALLRPLNLMNQSDSPGGSISERSAALVNSFLELSLAAVGNQQVDNRSSELSSFIKLLLQIVSTLPVTNHNVSPVDCQTIQLLAELRFLINDARLSEEFFLNLMFTADFWMNTHKIELINEFWSFVKAIYSQNPILYNNVFPIQNLIDFMIKICDATKEGAFCCEYHKKTFFMLYSPWQNEQQQIISQRSMSPTHSLQMQSPVDRDGSSGLQLEQHMKSKAAQYSSSVSRDLPFYHIDKFLEPIAGVLEYVLTSGGNEILAQIQFIAKSLTVKSCACFHMQMLKLLKVLLLDKSDNDCNSPGEFASKFLDVNGLQILLYLCQNASFDVKTMCIKLIDVLSSQTQLISMRIDTDLVTYLSHVILPEQLVQSQLQSTQALHHLRMHMVDDQNFKQVATAAITSGNNDGDTGMENNRQTSPIKQCQFFAFEEVSPDKDQNSHDGIGGGQDVGFSTQQQEARFILGNGASSSEETPLGVSPQFNGLQSQNDPVLNQINSQNPVPIIQPPSISKKAKKSTNKLFIASDDHQFDEKEEIKKPVKAPSLGATNKNLNASPPVHKTGQQLMDDFAEQDELQKKSVSPMLKPTPGKNMFNFGSFIDSSKSPSLSPDKNFRGGQPISPDSEAKPIPAAGRQPAGLQLQSQGSSAEARDRVGDIEESKKSNRPRLMEPVLDNDHSQDDYERDSDGQNSPELIIPKQSRAPRQQSGARFNAFTQPHPPSTRNKPQLAFGQGSGASKTGPKGLNIMLSSDEEDYDKFMPPTRDAFEKKYGDTILADYDEDEPDINNEKDRGLSRNSSKNDTEAPKPTADVMMSRNLKGGAGKNFNFAFSSDGDDSHESPLKNDGRDEDDDDDGSERRLQDDFKAGLISQPKFGSRPINLLSQKAGKGSGSVGGVGGVRKGFIKPLITTDEDQLDSLFIKNEKADDIEETKGGALSDLDVSGKGRKPTSFLQQTSASNSLNENTDAHTNPPSHGPTSMGEGEPQGTTGATNDINLDTPSCSSEQSSAKKTQKSHLNRKAPGIKLAIDIVSINNQFNYGGEKGELKPEEMEQKLESDIMELAAKCVNAMRRAKKHKPRTKFNQLLAQEMGMDDDEEDEEQEVGPPYQNRPITKQEGHILGLHGWEDDADDAQDDDDDENQSDEGNGDDDDREMRDDGDELENAIDEALMQKGTLLNQAEQKVEEQMQIALADDARHKIRGNIHPSSKAPNDPSLNNRAGNDYGAQIENVSDNAENGDQLLDLQQNQTDLNVEIMGDRLSYEELFKKNKKRVRSDRNSMANYSSGIGEIQLLEGNQTMTKSLRKSMFNEPMSVRGIKRIEIEEDEKNARIQERLDEEIKEQQQQQQVASQDPPSDQSQSQPDTKAGKGKHKLTLTNIVEEEISPTSKSSASLVGKPKSIAVPQSNANEAFDPSRKFENTQGMSAADDKELLEEQSLHSGSVERYLLNHSAGQLIAKDKDFEAKQQTQRVHKVRDKMLFVDAEDNGGIDDYTQELENLYTSCLEWLLNRSPNGLFKNLIIDDYDKITFQPALHILMTLVSYSNNLVRQRALQDLHTLAQLDPQNGQLILQSPKFHSWLLELLMPYQDFNTAQSVLSDSSRAVYDMGCKLHTLLLKNQFQNPEEHSFKRINLLTRWPAFIQHRFLNRMCEEESGSNRPQYHCREFDSANRVTRSLLTQLINSFKEDQKQDEQKRKKQASSQQTSNDRQGNGFKLSNPVNRNLVHLTLQVEELILSSHQKSFDQEQSKNEQQKNADYIDVNDSLFRWIQRDYLTYQSGTGSSMGLWAEWDLVEALLTQLNPLFHESVYDTSNSLKQVEITFDMNQKSIEIEEQVIQLLMNKNEIDYSNDIEVLMYEQNAPGVSAVQQAATSSSYGFSFPSSRFSIVNRMTGQTPSNQASAADQSQSSANAAMIEQTFMKALLNIICITIEQTDTEQSTYLWLNRLERFVKHLFIVSEVWKSKNEQLYTQVQKKIAEAIAFAFAFLFHEVNNTGTPKSTNATGQNQFGSTASPQEKVLRTKLFAQTLKNLTIFLVNIVHYSNQMMIHTAAKPSMASQTFSYFTGSSSLATSAKGSNDNLVAIKETPLTTPASRILLQTIFVKQYQGQTNVECLLSMQDIKYQRESNFEDFPELFHQNEWKVAFFHNKVLSAIKRKQLNLKTLEQFETRRRTYSQQILDSISKNEKAKDEILKRIQEETLETIGSLSEQEFERKNKDALLIDNFIRERHVEKRTHLKQVLGAKGTWRQKWDPTFQKVTLQDTGEGTHCLLVDRPSNAFTLLKCDDVEKNIFEQVLNKEFAHVEDRILNQGRVEKMLQMFQDSTSRSSDMHNNNQPNSNSSPTSNKVPSVSNNKAHNEESEEDLEAEQNEISSDEDSMRNVGHAQQNNRFSDSNEVLNGTEKGMTSRGQSKHMIEHFSKTLTSIQKKDLKRLYISYLREQFFLNRTPARKVIIESPCEILQPLNNYKGFMCMTNYELIFFYEMDINEEEAAKSNIFFFELKIPETKSYLKVISLSQIKEIQRRYFLTQKTALEIFLINNKNMLLNFPDQDMRDQFAKKILRQRKTKCKNLKYYTSLDPKWILRKKDLTEQWQNWKISNFEYLMQLNQLAGRSYNDLSQYPILPWLFSTYASQQLPDLSALQQQPRGGAPPGQFRDLTKNMQLLGTATRQAEFQRKYEDAESFIGLDDRFHCGSHFSNPGIVLHYLSRLAPYVEANVELHGRTLDNPERVFSSLDQSFRNALEDFQDVRELTPEFYFLPEMFVNHNKCNFGFKQNGQKVNNVALPAWADQNAHKFVQVMREGIESQYVSNNLHTWIDFIFGCKQRDQEAIMSLNTFSKITYAPEKEGDFDVSLVSDPVLKAAYESQGYNYGQTPTQLFKMNESHPPKKKQEEALKSNLVVDIVARLKVFKPVPNQEALQRAKQGAKSNAILLQISNEAILYAKFVGEQKIVGATKDGHVQHFVWLPRAHDLNPSTPFSLGGDKKLKFNSVSVEHGIDQIDRSIKKFDQPILTLNEGKNVIRGGYWDGRIVFSDVDSQSNGTCELRAHQSSVSAMAIDSREQVLITGSKSGEVIVWKNSDFECSVDPQASSQHDRGLNNRADGVSSAASKWFNFKQLNDHDRQISSIFINNEMCLFVTGSFDGTVNLYNLHTAKLIRTFCHPTLAPIYSVVLAQNPLAVCAFFSREDHLWTSFSINGKLLSDLSKLTNSKERITNQRVLTEECSHVISPQVIKDSYHMDKLVYGTEKGYIVLRMLPSMLRFRRLQVSNDFPVLTVLVSPDRRFLHVGCGDGGLIVIQAK